MLIKISTQNDLRTPYQNSKHFLGSEAHTQKFITLFLLLRHLESKRRKLTSKYVIPTENTENALNERLSKGLTGVSYKGRARNGLSQVG